MQRFFIDSLRAIVSVAVVLMGVGIVLAALSAAASPQGGPLAAIAVLVGGFIYLVMVAGFIYLQMGIHDNTRRTAEAVEALLRRQG